jgi:hypothetical protein
MTSKVLIYRIFPSKPKYSHKYNLLLYYLDQVSRHLMHLLGLICNFLKFYGILICYRNKHFSLAIFTNFKQFGTIAVV